MLFINVLFLEWKTHIYENSRKRKQINMSGTVL
jgi:hypothetical protein